MNKTKERKRIKVLIVSILALAMLLSIIGFVNSGSQRADAFSSESEINPTNANYVGDLMLENYENRKNKVFNEEVFWNLITRISGEKNPTVSTLDTLGATVKTSGDFRNIDGNNSKDVVVTIGGRKWTATYLSQNRSGEPILTFWLSTTTDKAIMTKNPVASYYTNFPTQMYGTSWMRASVLNNGGKYAENPNDEELTKVDQDINSQWAIYTMTKEQGVAGSLTEFIEVPDNIDWQREQTTRSSLTLSWNNDNNNDGIYNGRTYGAAYENLSTKSGYTNWKDDKLWLPSLAETGAYGSMTGLWKISYQQRLDCEIHSWTRTADYESSCNYSTNYNGNYYDRAQPDTEHIYRPAFHLKLKSVAEKAGTPGYKEPVDVSNPYTGEKQDLSNIADTTKTDWFDSSIMEVKSLDGEVRDVGTYRFKATITSSDENDVFTGEPDQSKGENANNKERIFNFTITKKKIGVTISDDGKTVTPNSGAICSYDKDKEERLPKLVLSYKTSGGTP